VIVAYSEVWLLGGALNYNYSGRGGGGGWLALIRGLTVSETWSFYELF